MERGGGEERRKSMRKRSIQTLLTWRGLFGEAEQLFDLCREITVVSGKG